MRPDHQLSKVTAGCEIEPPVTVTNDVALIRANPLAEANGINIHDLLLRCDRTIN
jgi:hypothetical protein